MPSTSRPCSPTTSSRSDGLPLLFIELRFFVFFAVVLAVAWGLRGHRAHKAWLLAASYVFYGAWDWRFLSLVWVSTLVDYEVGRRLGQTEDDAARKRLLWVSLVCNLGLLGFFKYFNFFIESAATASGWLGLPLSVTTLSVILPAGISFYTLQTLSYTIDVYRRKLVPTSDLLDFALFVGFFPQLVAGPVVRASDFLPQLDRRPVATHVHVQGAVLLFALGFFKKACVADNVAPFVDAYYASPETWDAASGWLATLLYAVQMYGDFSGYSDMAIACAALLGYRLCLNFDHPFFAPGLAQFWARWNISVSLWLRDYLYISLGGNRGSKLFAYRNTMITFVLGGLWHGASWNLVIWGAMHGLGLVIQREAAHRFGHLRAYREMPPFVGMLLMLWWVTASFAIFRAESFSDALLVLQSYLWFASHGPEHLPSVLWAYLAGLLALHVAFFGGALFKRLEALPAPVFYTLTGVAAVGMFTLIPTEYRPFIYFQF
ncbi:MAG: MBOAT family protein [Deltaproteobacteria bacterium]|nr:MAG: MBOAT family protein [Deltaproteobacteria bacterium]